MRNIREDAIFFESGYADKAVGRSATASDNKETFFPDWSNFTFRNITVANARNFVNATGLKGFPVHDLIFDNVHVYGVIKEPLLLKYCDNFRFTNCTYSGGTSNTISNCKNIVYNGKDLAE